MTGDADASAGWREEYHYQHCSTSAEGNAYGIPEERQQHRTLIDAKDTAAEKCRVTSTTAAVSQP